MTRIKTPPSAELAAAHILEITCITNTASNIKESTQSSSWQQEKIKKSSQCESKSKDAASKFKLVTDSEEWAKGHNLYVMIVGHEQCYASIKL